MPPRGGTKAVGKVAGAIEGHICERSRARRKPGRALLYRVVCVWGGGGRRCCWRPTAKVNWLELAGLS